MLYDSKPKVSISYPTRHECQTFHLICSKDDKTRESREKFRGVFTEQNCSVETQNQSRKKNGLRLVCVLRKKKIVLIDM